MTQIIILFFLAVQNVTATVRPTEATSVGGLATGGVGGKAKNTFVDLTKDDSGRPLPDSREVSFNKLQGLYNCFKFS